LSINCLPVPSARWHCKTTTAKPQNLQKALPMRAPYRLLSTATATAICALLTSHAFAAPLLGGAGPTRAWTYAHNAGNGFSSEIVSFDARTQTLWVAGVSGVDVLNASTGALLQRIDTRAYGSINSVAIHNGVAAMAFESTVRTDPGVVKLFDTSSRNLAAGVNSISVGALPDMLTFTPDGSRLLVANEATPSTYGALTSAAGSFPRSYGAPALDPVGSVSIINMASLNSANPVSKTATLAGVARSGSVLRTNTGMDFEPEYIAVNAAGTRAYVTLQEANGLGVLNLQTGLFEQIIGLGVKDFNQQGNRIDPLNNGTATLTNVAVKGLYQPDAIAAFEANGKTFLVMANEGDFREDDGDRSAASNLGATGVLANLRVSNTDSSAGDLYAAGARSFSIRDEAGNLVYDSGEILDREAIAAGIYDDARSRDKGVEPEGVELMVIDGRTYAFIGLERTLKAAVALFDVSDPVNTRFVRLLVSDGDRAPEGLKGFVLGGVSYLAFSNETSNTTTVMQLTQAVPEPGTLALSLVALAALAWRRNNRSG
jgi:DNA-binding beta-propeller fold protein YncE